MIQKATKHYLQMGSKHIKNDSILRPGEADQIQKTLKENPATLKPYIHTCKKRFTKRTRLRELSLTLETLINWHDLQTTKYNPKAASCKI